MILSAHKLGIRFAESDKSDENWLFRDLSFNLYPGDGLIICGPSGSGKTTLLTLLANQNNFQTSPALEGSINHCLEGSALVNLGMLFQENRLLPHLNIMENATLAADLAGYPGKESRIAASQYLDQLGMSHLKNRKPSSVSGGEGRRVALIRALVARAPIILADEPDSGLDQENGMAVWNLLCQARAMGSAIVAACHQKPAFIDCSADENFSWSIIRIGTRPDNDVFIPEASELAKNDDVFIHKNDTFIADNANGRGSIFNRLSTYLRLSLRHMRHRPLLFLVLCLCFCALLAVPISSMKISAVLSTQPLRRASAFPLLAGAPASPFQLVMSEIYRRGKVDRTLEYGDYLDLLKWWRKCGFQSQPQHQNQPQNQNQMQSPSFTGIIPLHCLHSTGKSIVAGTTLHYFDALGITLEKGDFFQILGDTVIGSTIAQQRKLAPGDTIVAGNPDPWDITGTPPVKLKITGVLAPTLTPDDNSLFVDLKTAWTIDGALHGHQKAVGRVTDPSMKMVTELADSDLSTFHLHGNMKSMPLSSMAIFPAGTTQEAIIAAQLSLRKEFQIIRPRKVASEALDVIFDVKGFFDLHGMALSGVMAVALLTILWLSFRFREAEASLLRDMGCSTAAIFTSMGSEILWALIAGFMAAMTLSDRAMLLLDRIFS